MVSVAWFPKASIVADVPRCETKVVADVPQNALRIIDWRSSVKGMDLALSILRSTISTKKSFSAKEGYAEQPHGRDSSG